MIRSTWTSAKSSVLGVMFLAASFGSAISQTVEHYGVACIPVVSPGCVATGIAKIGDCWSARFTGQGAGSNPAGHRLSLFGSRSSQNYSSTTSLIGNVFKPVALTQVGGTGIQSSAKARILLISPANLNASNYVTVTGDIVGYAGANCNVRFWFAGVKPPIASARASASLDPTLPALPDDESQLLQRNSLGNRAIR
jgi:hypothetical protein